MLTDSFRFLHGHRLDAYGLLRTIVDYLTDTSRTLTDSHVQFLIFSWTPHGRSETLTDNFRFSTDTSRTLTDSHEQFLILYGHLTDAHRHLRTIFDFPTDTSRI